MQVGFRSSNQSLGLSLALPTSLPSKQIDPDRALKDLQPLTLSTRSLR